MEDLVEIVLLKIVISWFPILHTGLLIIHMSLAVEEDSLFQLVNSHHQEVESSISKGRVSIFIMHRLLPMEKMEFKAVEVAQEVLFP